jgi:predicted alpha/beta-hydrolase family hydrolase
MQGFHKRLAALGPTESFDYAYQREGRRAPDRQPVLVATHRQEFERIAAAHPRVVLAGKSMGSRIGCHVAAELQSEGPAALVCFGYPLVGQNGAVRDLVLLELRTPILFVQGTRDALCPLERLAEVRSRMLAESELHVVDEGDHSLLVTRSRLKRLAITQADIDAEVMRAVATFAKRSVAKLPI